VLEEDFSSPNDSLQIDNVERTGTAGERIKIRLSDGSCFFARDEDLKRLGIDPYDRGSDLHLSEATIRGLRDSSARIQAMDKALDLLARAPHSTFTLRTKLLRRKFETRVVEEILTSLLDNGYLDDAGFAEDWLRNRCERRPEGRAALLAGLLRKGIGRRLAEQVLQMYLTPELEREHALRVLEKLRRQGVMDQARLINRLKARGFAFPLIRSLLERPEEL